MSEIALRTGLNADHAASQLVRQGVVTEIRSDVSASGNQKFLLVNVDVTTQWGGRRTIYDCTTNIPVQVGSQVVLSLQYADQQRGGFIYGLTSTPVSQSATVRSPEYRELLLTDYVGPQDSGFGPYEIVPNVDDRSVEYIDRATSQVQNRQIWFTNGFNTHVIPGLTGIPAEFQDRVVARYNAVISDFESGITSSITAARGFSPDFTRVLLAGGLNTLDPDNPTGIGRIVPENEAFVVVTGDEMRFEVEQDIDVLDAQMYHVDTTGINVATYAGSGTEYVVKDRVYEPRYTPINILSLVWITLADVDTGERFVGKSLLSQGAMQVYQNDARELVIDIGEQQQHSRLWGSFLTNVRGNTLIVRFDGLPVGRRLRVECYIKTAIPGDKIASNILANTVRLNGRVSFQLRELGYGSGLRRF